MGERTDSLEPQSLNPQMSNTLTVDPAPVSAVAEEAPLAPDPSWPAWFVARREAAWHRYRELPAPARTDEKWRFSNLKRIDVGSYRPGAEAAAATIPDVPSIEQPVVRLVFANGRLVRRDGSAPAGLRVLPLEEALATCPELVGKHFMAYETPLGSEKFAALHLAHLRSGVFVHAAAGTEVAAPVEVVHCFSGTQALYFPHTLVVADTGSSVTVLEHVVSGNPDDSVFLVGVNDLVAGPGARVKYAAFQQLNAASKAIFVNATVAGPDADAKSFILNTGGAWVRNESVSHVTGEGANVNLLSASAPAGGQEVDQRTYQIHKARHTTSDLLYKNALFGRSRSIFSGLIIVDQGAHCTDAYQTCRNLLGSDEAEAHSLPGLEINADQVKCSHGSTTGQIDPDELFYLLARGIHEKDARKLITYGFLEEVVERFGSPAVGELADRLIEEKFQSLGD